MPLPSAVVSLAHHAVTGRPVFCHLLCTIVPNITVVVIHTLGHNPDAKPEAQNEIFQGCSAVDFML